MCSKLTTISDITTERSTVSIRVNRHIVDKCRELDIPVSLVAECSLIHFLSVSDEEKIRFINENTPEAVNITTIDKTKSSWKDMLQQNLEKFNIPSTIVPGLLVGVGAAAIGILGGILTSLAFKKE